MIFKVLKLIRLNKIWRLNLKAYLLSTIIVCFFLTIYYLFFFLQHNTFVSTVTSAADLLRVRTCNAEDIQTSNIYLLNERQRIELQEEIFEHLLEISTILPNTKDKALILIIGDRFTDTDKTLETIINIHSIRNRFIILNNVLSINSFFIQRRIINDQFLKDTNISSEEKYSIAQKYRFLLQYEFEKLKPYLIKKLIRNDYSIVSAIDTITEENLISILKYAKQFDYKIYLINQQVANQDLENNFQTIISSTGLQFNLEYVKQKQNVLNKIVTKAYNFSDGTLTIFQLPDEYKSNSFQFYENLNITKETKLDSILVGIRTALHNTQLVKKNSWTSFSPPPLSLVTLLDQKKKIGLHSIPILDDRFTYTTQDELSILSRITGQSTKSLVSLKPERLFLHILIAKIYNEFKGNSDFFQRLIKKIILNYQEKIESLYQVVEEDRVTITNEIERLIEHIYQGQSPQLTSLMSEIIILKKKIEKEEKISLKNQKKIILYYFVNKIYQEKAEKFFTKEIEEMIHEIRKEMKSSLLSKHSKEEAKVFFLIGGPGVGKSVYLSKFGLPQDRIHLNIDDLFTLLYQHDPYLKDIIFSDLSFDEVNILYERILAEIVRYKEQLSDILLEGLYLPQNLIQAYHLSNIEICFLTTFIPEALKRVTKREGGKQNPLGSPFVIDAHKKATQSLIEFIENYSTNLKTTIAVLHSDSSYYLRTICKLNLAKKEFEIIDIHLLLNFLGSAALNNYATDTDELYKKGEGLEHAVYNLRRLNKKYNLFLIDSESQKKYAQISLGGKLQIIDNLLYKVNIDPWLDSLLKKVSIQSFFYENRVYTQDNPELKYSRLANYLWVINKIKKLPTDNLLKVEKDKIEKYINTFKLLFENHCTNIIKTKETLKTLDYTFFPKSLEKQFQEIIQTFFHNFLSVPNPSPFDILANVRFYESSLAEKLLKYPPKEMMKQVGKVSTGIIKLIKANIGIVEDYIFIDFLDRLSTPHFTMGTFSKNTRLQDVIDLLVENNPDKIVDIMLVHFLFMDVCFRHLKVYQKLSPYNQLNLLWNPTHKTFKTTRENKDFIDSYLYKSDLFKERGRIIIQSRNPLSNFSIFNENNAYSSHTGIMVHYYLPYFEKKPYEWRQDKFSTVPDLKLSYIQEIQKHEIPYIAGPSGMATLFIPLALLGGMLDTQRDFCYYLLATVAYIVGGGLHSIHEVLTVAQYKLNLLTFSLFNEYQISGDEIGNYGDFFYFFKDDPEINLIKEAVWADLISFFARNLEKELFSTDLRLSHSTLDHSKFLTYISSYTKDQLILHQLSSQLEKVCSFKRIRLPTMHLNLLKVLKSLQTEGGILNFKNLIELKTSPFCLKKRNKEEIIQIADKKIIIIKNIFYNKRLLLNSGLPTN